MKVSDSLRVQYSQVYPRTKNVHKHIVENKIQNTKKYKFLDKIIKYNGLDRVHENLNSLTINNDGMISRKHNKATEKLYPTIV